MSDFFGNLQGGGIRLPEARFNDGGMLPPTSTAGYKNGLDGTADARINAASSLLGEVTPYAYGTSDRLTTQTAYLNSPHNIQKIIPQILLPDCAQSTNAHTFLLPHAVSDGDIAYSIRFDTIKARDSFLPDVHSYIRQGASRAIDYICNITTVNYILRGLQNKPSNPAWTHFAAALGGIIATKHGDLMNNLKTGDEGGSKDRIATLRHEISVIIFRDICRPIGVVIGSDKQGGQHQGSNKAITFPVDFVATVSVDGRNENLCNYWNCCDVNSGEALLLRLKKYKNERLKPTYNLNNHKYSVRKEFMTEFQEEIYQVCPVTRKKLFLESDCKNVINDGYWHFAMSQKMHRMKNDNENVTNIEQFHRGGLLQVTISPHFVNYSRKTKNNAINEGSTGPDSGGGIGKPPRRPSAYTKYGTQNDTQQNLKFSSVENRPVFMQNHSQVKRKQAATHLQSTPNMPNLGIHTTTSNLANKRSKVNFLTASSDLPVSDTPMVTCFNPTQVSRAIDAPMVTRFNPSQLSRVIDTPMVTSFIPNQASAASLSAANASTPSLPEAISESITSSTDNSSPYTVPITHVQSNNELITSVKANPKSIGKTNSTVIANDTRTAVNSASATTSIAAPKGRIKATRLAADPSIADTQQTGSRL